MTKKSNNKEVNSIEETIKSGFTYSLTLKNCSNKVYRIQNFVKLNRYITEIKLDVKQKPSSLEPNSTCLLELKGKFYNSIEFPFPIGIVCEEISQENNVVERFILKEIVRN